MTETFEDEEHRKSMARSNALQTLWGSGDPEADQARKNTAKSMISPGVREQTIYTPQCVLDVVDQLWPEGIALDPCSGPDSIVKAKDYCDLDAGKDGLTIPWPQFTFVNPPYKDLKKWLEKALHESGPLSFAEILLLVPVRTHRKWFREAMGYATETVFLDPLKFHGFKQAFPAPMCLMYFGQRPLKNFTGKVSK